MLLAGCATKSTFATLGSADPAAPDAGACSAFPRPQYAIRGLTPYDQQWADTTTEAGVAGCNWPRPAARPVEMDPPFVAPAKQSPKTKKRFLDRFRSGTS